LNTSGTVSIAASDINNGSNDNCGINSMSVSPNSFTCANVGANTVTLTVTDNNSNVSSKTAVVTVEDNVAPIAIAKNITVQLNTSGTVSIAASDINNGLNDNCGINSMSVSPNSFTCANVGSNTVTLTVTDNNSNVSTKTAVVTVEDNVAPAAIAKNITVQLDATGIVSIAASDINNGSNDNCGINSMSVSPNSFTCANVGSNTVTLTVTDNNSNVSSKTAVVTVEDNVAPIAIAKNITVQLNTSGTVSIAASDINNGSNDNCGINSMSVSPNSFTCANVGSNTVTLTVTDNNSNVSSKTAVVTVEDNVAPAAIAKNITVQLDATGIVSIAASDINNGSNDNCGINSMSVSPNSFTCANVGSNTVTLTVTDNNSNVSSKTAVVTVEDNVAPVANAKNITVQLNTSGTVSIVASDINNGSNDNCGINSMSVSPNSFTCANVGSNTVTLTVTDDNSNVSSKTAVVTVEDNVAPVALAKNITVQLDANGQVTIAEDAVNNGSSDACGGLNYDTNITSFDCTDVGDNTVELTVTDANGNSAKKTAIVTVEDNTAPNVITKNITIQLDASGNANISEDQVNNGSSDACGGLSFDTNITRFDCTDVGNNTVELTVTDANSNSAKKTAIVTVEDNINPDDPDLEQNIIWSCGEPVQIPTTTDNCSAEIIATTDDPLEYATFGVRTITWIFKDPSGNKIEVDQTINIPEPTVDIPNIDGNEFCNSETVPAIIFSGNNLANKRYEWSYKSDIGNSIDIGLSTSGIGDIPEFTAKNNGSQIINAVFTIIPFGNSCEGNPVNFSITIKPTPTMTKPDDIVVCEGNEVDGIIFPNNIFSVSNSSVTWTNDNTDIGLIASGNGNISSFTATNSGSENITSIITVTPSANNCVGIEQSFSITVKPKPEILDSPEDQTYCNGQTTKIITLQSDVNGTKYNITGGSGIGLANRTNVTEIPSFVAKTGSATITITPKANGCPGDPVTYYILVNPTPTLSVNTASQSICSEGTTAINLSGSAQSYSWILSEVGNNITGATEGSGNSIAQQLRNSGTQPQVVKYKITPKANGCAGTPITVKVSVNPIPEFTVNIPECQLSVDLTDSAIKSSAFTGLIYTYWSNAEATSQLQNPSEVGLGTYYIRGTTSSGCSLVKEVAIENIKPVLTSPLEGLEICSGNTFNYNPISNLNNITFGWSRDAVNGISNPASSSNAENQDNPNEILSNTNSTPITVTYIYTLTTSNGCLNEQSVEVIVNPTPLFIEHDYQNEICGGDEFSYEPQSSLSGTNFTWERRDSNGNLLSSGNGSVDEILYNDSNSNISNTYFFKLQNNSCENPEEYRVSVAILSSFNVDASASNNEICLGESIDLFSSTDIFANSSGVILDENFNSPTNWTTNNAGSSTWTRRNNYNPSGPDETLQNNGSYMVSNKYDLNSNSGNREANLISPTFSTKGYTSINLEFKLFYNDVSADWGDYAVVDYSLNDGNSWNYYGSLNQDAGSETNFDILSIPFNELIGYEQVKIRFRFLNNGNNARAYTWAIDDIKLAGESQNLPEIEWTSNTDSEWSSNVPNPVSVNPSSTTLYTVKYYDPELDCPGVATVEVIVRKPPNPTITANYCGDSQFIELISDNEYNSYRWEANGEVLGSSRRLDVDIAKTYTLTVTDDLGCEGTGYISVSNELIINGDFEDGVAGFFTEYRNRTNSGDLYPEGDFAVDDDAHDYHNQFYGRDHTTGNGNFMIINGHPGSGKVIWRQIITNIQPNTNYYFNAWGMNVNPGNPAQLQFRVNNVNTGTIADLRDAPTPINNNDVNRENWVQFYSNPFWNSGNSTQAVLEIVNLETIRSGNDFALDDISFGTLEQIVFEIDPDNNSILCEGEELELNANIEGGRFPITFEWTGPTGSNFSNKTTVNTLEELNEAVTLKIPNITADMAGTYTLKVTDFYGCTAKTGTTEVKVLQINAGEDQTVCSNIGTVQLNAEILGSSQGGTWSGGEGTFSSNTALDATYVPSENEILTGSVELTLTSNDPDATCSDQVVVSFNNSPEAEVTLTPSTCFGANDGTATVTVIDETGVGPFTYVWTDDSGTVIQTMQTATGLGPNPNGYTVTVTDSNGCSVTITSEAIEEPTALEILQTSNTNVTCFGGADGTTTLEVTGGFIPPNTPAYILSLLDKDGNEVLVENSNNSGVLLVENLLAGVYTFTANTVNGCSLLSENVTIDQPLEIIVEAGNNINIAECGTTLVSLNATPVDPELGAGRWEIISSSGTGNTSFQDNLEYNTPFIGESGATYELAWIVTPVIDGCSDITDTITVTLPPACSKLNFDGVDDYVDAGDQYSMGGSDFSVEAWVKPNSISGVNTIISKRIAGESNIGYDLFLNNGAPSFRVRNRTVTSTISIGTDRWYHIAAVYTSTKISLYVDGIEVQNNTNNIPNGSGNFNAPFLIGATHAPTEAKLTKQHFNGFIEEVRIWEKPISQDQIQFFMNQRLQKNGTMVEGAILLKGLNLPNSPALPNWSSLKGYYQLLAKNDLIKDGFTPNLGTAGESIKGVLKNIQLMQENTAPLPYILNSDNGSWFSKSTWQLPLTFDGISEDFQFQDVWDAPGSIGINGDVIEWNIVKLNGKSVKNIEGNNIQLLALLDGGGSLNMEGNIQSTGSGLTITHYLKLNGSIDLNGESQLIQTEGSILEPTSSGYIERDQQGKRNSFIYNYWSSPVSVQGPGNNVPYTIESVLMDGTTASNPQTINFDDQYWIADGGRTTPITISTYWLWGYSPAEANIYAEWDHILEDGPLNTGEGFTMKGTDGTASISADQNYTFRGKPHNGDILLPKIAAGQNYLIGNPYPSAMDANKFILDNLNAADVSGANNTKNIFNGALYFWDHFARKNHILLEYVGGYATRNLTGGVPAASTDERINANGAQGTKIPGQFIPVAQGFYINSVLDTALSDVDTITGGHVIFKNSQRAFVKETNPENSQFLRPENNSKKDKQEDTRAKIRLDFRSPMGYHRQILVGADPNTTNGFDLGYDAALNDNNPEDMFWLINGNEFVIQGVPNFDLEQVLPLGIKLKEEGDFSIKINKLENIAEDVNIYLKNLVDSTYFDLRKADFTMKLEPGNYNERFQIVFQKEKIPTEEPDPEEETEEEEQEQGSDGGSGEEEFLDGNIEIFYMGNHRELVILNPEKFEIERVIIYDMLGAKIQEYQNVSNEEEVWLPVRELPAAVYAIKLFSGNKEISKSIILIR